MSLKVSQTTEIESLVDAIRNSIIGADHTVEGPFGARRVTYTDYTASGRCIAFIENFIRAEVMPLYANTHTEASGTGLQTTRYREDARAIIKKAVGGDERDAVIFCDSGATGAINRLLAMLNLRIPADLDAQYDLSQKIPKDERPVVFIGPYEHHSNELPWRESIADVVVIDEDEDGRISVEELSRQLKIYAKRPLKIGSFSAASNVTGIGSDTRAISRVLHQHDALSFWDFAAAAPYVKIEMNMSDDSDTGDLIYKDAIFLSPHKFIGGPGTPGILVVKKSILKNSVPAIVGGGTVSYVNCKDHAYLDDIEHREEGGTPSIIGSIRAGLVFQLKEAVGTDEIEARERSFVQRAIKRWSKHPNIQILGNPDAWRLSILSFTISHQNLFLHHNYVTALLNDIFGVQSRGGCSCAGPYGHRLLNIDLTRSKLYEHVILEGYEGIKPGWARLNFNYFLSEATFEFILDAVEWVASKGYKLLPCYRFDLKTGLWHHHARKSKAPLSLHDLKYSRGRLTYRSQHGTEPEWVLPTYLEEADAIAEASVQSRCDQKVEALEWPNSAVGLKWFVFPQDVAHKV